MDEQYNNNISPLSTKSFQASWSLDLEEGEYIAQASLLCDSIQKHMVERFTISNLYIEKPFKITSKLDATTIILIPVNIAMIIFIIFILPRIMRKVK